MGQTPAQLANLRPFGPDNPPPRSPGRPRKRPLSEAYEDWLRELVDARTVAHLREEGVRIPLDCTNGDLVAMQMGREAIRGNVNAAKEMREAVEGKSVTRVELTTPEDRGFEVRVSFELPEMKTVQPLDVETTVKNIETAVGEAIAEKEDSEKDDDGK